jgi:hypothetical protein
MGIIENAPPGTSWRGVFDGDQAAPDKQRHLSELHACGQPYAACRVPENRPADDEGGFQPARENLLPIRDMALTLLVLITIFTWTR